jgi:hypothetical protein
VLLVQRGDPLLERVVAPSLEGQRLEQPYRIVIRAAGVQTFAYEPMKSELVRSRFDPDGQTLRGCYEGVE